MFSFIDDARIAYNDFNRAYCSAIELFGPEEARIMAKDVAAAAKKGPASATALLHADIATRIHRDNLAEEERVARYGKAGRLTEERMARYTHGAPGEQPDPQTAAPIKQKGKQHHTSSCQQGPNHPGPCHPEDNHPVPGSAEWLRVNKEVASTKPKEELNIKFPAPDYNIQRNLVNHRPSEDTQEWMEEVRGSVHNTARFFDHLPSGRERSLALTKLEEATMWAMAALARADWDQHHTASGAACYPEEF